MTTAIGIGIIGCGDIWDRIYGHKYGLVLEKAPDTQLEAKMPLAFPNHNLYGAGEGMERLAPHKKLSLLPQRDREM